MIQIKLQLSFSEQVDSPIDIKAKDFDEVVSEMQKLETLSLIKVDIVASLPEKAIGSINVRKRVLCHAMYSFNFSFS